MFQYIIILNPHYGDCKLNIQSNLKSIYYVDYSGAIQKEQSSGGCYSRLTRLISSLWRNYDLFQVHEASHCQKNNLSDKEKKFISKRLFKKCGITEWQHKKLRSITKNGYHSSSKFLKEICANKKFNDGIKKLQTKGTNFFGVSNQVLGEVSVFSYKTTMKKAFIVTANKAEKIFSQYSTGQIIPETGKLNLNEVRELESVAKMQPLLNKIIQSNRKHFSTLKGLHAASEKAVKTIESMLKKAEEEAPCLPGTFIVYDQENDYALRGQSVSSMQKFISKKLLGTNISHIAVGFTSEDNKDIEAHMWGSPVSKYTHSRRSLGNRCFKTIRMNIDKMVESKEMTKLYGKNWQNLVHDKYSLISKDHFLNNPDLKKLHNPPFKRLMAAIGFRFSIFKQSWQERCQFPTNHKVICSEFATMASLQCLSRLETEIQKDWKKQFPGENTLPKITPPVRDNRRLNRLLPNEIVKRSISTGCASIMDPSDCIKKMIQFNDAALVF